MLSLKHEPAKAYKITKCLWQAKWPNCLQVTENKSDPLIQMQNQTLNKNLKEERFTKLDSVKNKIQNVSNNWQQFNSA